LDDAAALAKVQSFNALLSASESNWDKGLWETPGALAIEEGINRQTWAIEQLADALGDKGSAAALVVILIAGSAPAGRMAPCRRSSLITADHSAIRS
jgi:hypothetical protein